MNMNMNSINKPYKHFFDIDENYYSSISDELLAGKFIDWNSFYPHSTFVTLLKNTASILRREQQLSVWVEGEYGTGKSHAVFTLKKILDASEDEVLKYFQENDLDMDLFKKLQGAKNQEGKKILTVHRVGSSSIKGDNLLVSAIQESVKKALKDTGAEFQCEDSLKDGIIKWLSDEVNARNFNNYIEARYKLQFGADTSEKIVQKLKTGDEETIAELSRKIFNVAEKEGITALKLEARDLEFWIKDVIAKNNLKAIVFIWDEFTEYFKQNINSITGFQTLTELSQRIPFYFIIVTHTSLGLFNPKDESKKIIDRFIKPTCRIELPDNMAFKLLGKAMKTSENPVTKKEWEDHTADLIGLVPRCNQVVMKSVKVDETDLKKILPIHPYTAVLLKHLSVLFGSNQRSMFDFIRNKRGEVGERSFNWYIENYGPISDENLLTIDMLWDYFYSDGKANLEAGIKSLLGVYDMHGNSSKLTVPQQRVLKTALLLQGISEKNTDRKNTDRVELLRPTLTNINNAYEGTNLGMSTGQAAHILKTLEREGILFPQTIGSSETQYLAMRSGSNTDNIKKYIEDFRGDKKTKVIVEGCDLTSFLTDNLTPALKLRYELNIMTVDDFDSKNNRIVNRINQTTYINTIPLILTFAKDEKERAVIISEIRKIIKELEVVAVFVDASLCDLSEDNFEEYIKNLAEAKEWLNKDGDLSRQYQKAAEDVIARWISKIKDSELRIMTKDKDKDEEKKVYGVSEAVNALNDFNKKIFGMGIEYLNVTQHMFNQSNFNQGSKLGIEQRTSGQFDKRLAAALEGVWQLPEGAAPNTNHLVYKIKVKLDAFINERFVEKGEVSIDEIYEFLKADPYGFLPCSLSAFISGFLLKDYVCEKYRWSNGTTGEEMSVEKMAEMIDEIIKLQNKPDQKYRDKFIRKTTLEEREFLVKTAYSFGIDENSCANVEKTREQLRTAIKSNKIGLPLWSISIALKNERPVDYLMIIELIDLYCKLVNNRATGKSDNDIAIEIGRIFIGSKVLHEKLKPCLCTDYCKKGMLIYLSEYNDGELQKLAEDIGCTNNILSHLKAKATDASSWLWEVETINTEIEKLIVEYKIVLVSNKYVTKCENYKDTIIAWAEAMEYFKLPFEGVKNDFPNIKELLEYLSAIFTSKSLPESNKIKFLATLNDHADEFYSHYKNQVEWFKEKCNFELFGLSDADISKIFSNMPLKMYSATNATFQQIASTQISSYRKTILIEELKELWKANTNTSSPREWSDKYKTPILCLVDTSEYDVAKKALETITQKGATDTEIKDAINYFKCTKLFSKMIDETTRDTCFIEKLIADYIIIKDIELTREELSKRLQVGAYDWYPKTKQADDILKQLAKNIYEKTGCNEALSKIEIMSEIDAKLYLKRLIRERMEVGMEILKDE